VRLYFTVAAQADGHRRSAAYREADDYSAASASSSASRSGSCRRSARLLLSMKVDLQATRALLAETATWVDLWKGYERDHRDRARAVMTATQPGHKAVARVWPKPHSDGCLKYAPPRWATGLLTSRCRSTAAWATCLRVQYRAALPRRSHHNIYEGTSQLQVVAAIGKLLNPAISIRSSPSGAAAEFRPTWPPRRQLRRADFDLPQGRSTH